MKKLLLFVGNKFVLNTPLQQYIVREIEEKSGKIDGLFFFQESDNTLFLELERLLSQETILILITTKSTFSVVGKLLSTVTSDNQILKEKMLLPSRTIIFEPDSYLLNYKNAQINVLIASEGKQLPNILIEDEERTALIQLFNEDIESADAMLTPLAQTYDVRIDYTEIVSGWLLLQPGQP